MHTTSTTPPSTIDALIIGAGPAGLFQVFQCGLQGMHTHIVDTLPTPGGQCHQLYGDKPIYDIPGIPICTGDELVERLLRQIQPFAPTWHHRCTIDSITAAPDGRWLVTAEQGQQWLTSFVFIAAGVGAFTPRKLNLDGMAALENQQVWYHQHGTTEQRDVLIQGGDAIAVLRAIDLATAAAEHTSHSPRSVTLIHRRDIFDAPADTLAALKNHRDRSHLKVMAASITQLHTIPGEHGTTRLTGVQLTTPSGDECTLPVDTLEAYLGLSPRLGPLSTWGLAMERKQLQVHPATMGTSATGIYAVGDINHYLGKRKLIVCAFHEATLAAMAAAESRAGHPLVLQYTSSSQLLQQRLGVRPLP